MSASDLTALLRRRYEYRLVCQRGSHVTMTSDTLLPLSRRVLHWGIQCPGD